MHTAHKYVYAAADDTSVVQVCSGRSLSLSLGMELSSSAVVCAGVYMCDVILRLSLSRKVCATASLLKRRKSIPAVYI